MQDRNSGFLADGDIIGDYSTSFNDIEVVDRRGIHFFASASRFGRRWFLKGICREFATTSSRQQLLKEFEILSRLSHPAVVTSSSIEEVEGLGLCIIMEWIEGRTLKSLLDEGALPKMKRRQLLTEIVEAMAYVHSHGIVHRDLKPDNIMVRSNGENAVIVDFGLADADEYTILKSPAGTAGYMSERQQVASTPYTGDDVYGLGVIMQSLYPEYRDIIRRCTGASEKRFANAGELLQAIRFRGRRKHRALIAGVFSAAVAAVIVIAILLIHGQRLSSSMNELGIQLDSVSVNADQERRQRLALTDSLRLLGAQLDKEREFNARIKEHDALMQTAKRRLKDELERVYQHFLHSDVNPTYGDPQAALRLIGQMTSAKDAILVSFPGLDNDDRETLEQSYAIYQGDILHRWTKNQNL